MAIAIDKALCTGCGKCYDICPEDVYAFSDRQVTVKYPDECWWCGSCQMDCPTGALKIRLNANVGPVFIKKEG